MKKVSTATYAFQCDFNTNGQFWCCTGDFLFGSENTGTLPGRRRRGLGTAPSGFGFVLGCSMVYHFAFWSDDPRRPSSRTRVFSKCRAFLETGRFKKTVPGRDLNLCAVMVIWRGPNSQNSARWVDLPEKVPLAGKSLDQKPLREYSHRIAV